MLTIGKRTYNIRYFHAYLDQIVPIPSAFAVVPTQSAVPKLQPWDQTYKELIQSESCFMVHFPEGSLPLVIQLESNPACKQNDHAPSQERGTKLLNPQMPTPSQKVTNYKVRS